MRQSKADKLELLRKKMVHEIWDYAIILLDLDGTILTWNEEIEKLKGYTPDEIIGQNFSIFYLPHDRVRRLPEVLLRIAAEEGRAEQTAQRVRKNGTTFLGNIVLTAIRDDSGEVIGFTELSRGISEPKK